MRKIYVTLGILISLVAPLAVSAATFAQTSAVGGGNSKDYQPDTGNPQGSVGSGYQTTGTGLQPAPGQTNLSQEKLTGSSNLQIAGVQGSQTPNTTSIPPYKEKKSFNWFYVLYVLIAGLTIWAIVYVVRQPGKEKQSKAAITPEEKPTEIIPEIQQQATKAKKKPTKKKSSSKKRKK